jgi:hypothetical protein
MKQSYLPEGFAIVLFALVMFLLSAVLVIASIVVRDAGMGWWPNAELWIALCINAHSIISRLTMRD